MYYGLVVMQLFLTQLLQKLLLSKKGDRYFLPGGGMEGTETKDECLHRELLEELGWAIEINQYIGNAMRYFYAEKRRYLLFKRWVLLYCEHGAETNWKL